jgi:hypothetical protein
MTLENESNTANSGEAVIENTKSILERTLPTLIALFTVDVAPKRIRQIVLDFVWYVFIMIVVGQLGVVLAIGIAFWDDKPIWDAIVNQANSGNLLTFAVALIAGSGYFVVKEFHGETGVKRAHLKSPLLLMSIAVGLAGALVSATLTKAPPDGAMTQIQLLWHWVLYCLCIVLSTCWWMLEEGQGSVTDLGDDVNSNSRGMAKKSKVTPQVTSTKVKV